MHVYTFGNEPYGESILFTIEIENKISFSGLIDAFIKEDNQLLKKINELGITELDYFCLTHPDTDHCKGLEKILDLLTEKTIFTYPFNLFEEEYIENYGNNVKESLLLVKDLIKSKKNKFVIKGCANTVEAVSGISYMNEEGRVFPLGITTITPITNIFEAHHLECKDGDVKKIYQNEYSVANLITFGDIQLFLSSDIGNESILEIKKTRDETIKKFFSSDIEYLKIPHHSSPNSVYLFDLINDLNIGNSVTTVFRNFSLPDESIIDSYKNVSEKVYSTGKIKKEKEPDKYGIVELVYNLDKHSIIKRSLEGNAICVK